MAKKPYTNHKNKQPAPPRKAAAPQQAGNKQKRRPQPARKQEEPPAMPQGGWIGMRTGLIVMTVLSLGMAIFVTVKFYDAEGLPGALLWGLGFGASIWAVAALSYVFNRILRGGRR